MQRVKNVQDKLSKYNIDALLVTNMFNVRYLANFTGTTGLVVITKDESYFVTDFRYTEQAAEEAKGFTIVKNEGPIFEEVAKIVQEDKIENLGFEQENITYAVYNQINDIIPCELVPVTGLVEKLREVKTEDEINIIKEAINITEKAYDYILGFVKPGKTEIEVANELDFYMRNEGATSVSFDTIVASGVRSAMPHGVASDKVIEEGDMVTIDFGCYYKGYVSDMTRTFAVGDPGEQMKEIYEIVYQANKKVNEVAKAGMTGAELDAIARDYIAEKGYGPQFGHTLGHGIGLEVHEGPSLSFRNEDKLVVNNIVTNEPGIYVPGLGGVRIEDDLVIKEDGAEILMTTPKELIIL
ncbi:MAG TPA: Xaa-Pro peptidase family protein [Atopostipes sp.]|nr:Xaa-Pro peptidase family protein [Atopostipes sp.]